MQERIIINGKSYTAVGGDEVVRRAGEALVDEELTKGYTSKVLARMQELSILCPTQSDIKKKVASEPQPGEE